MTTQVNDTIPMPEMIPNETGQERKIREYTEAMRQFVDRCDAGEIRSQYTYDKFKELLQRNYDN